MIELQAEISDAIASRRRATPWALLVAVVGASWAILLVVGAASLPLWMPGVTQVAPDVTLLLTATGLAAGQFVFCMLVADRLFPRASRPLRGVVELLSALGMLIAPMILALLLLTETAS